MYSVPVQAKVPASKLVQSQLFCIGVGICFM